MAGIAISGKSGCGTTTATNNICELLGIPRWNFTFRDLAAESGKTLAQMQEIAISDQTVDMEIDRRQVRFACSNDKYVLGSRLGVWLDDPRLLSQLSSGEKPVLGLKVWLEAPFEVRATRIFEREGGDIAKVKAFVEKRDRENHARYLELYGINMDVLPKDAIVIDTVKYDAVQVSKKIMELAMGKV